MEELHKILAAHAERYPKMQPQDAVKLVYQNEFGCGHLLRDREMARLRLEQEIALTPPDSAVPLTEEIGNGLIRLNLASPERERYPTDVLFEDFAATAEQHQGSRERFFVKLDLLREAADSIFGFSCEDLDGWLAGYAAAGYPPVSHSGIYRQEYRPAYRVLLRERAEQSRGGLIFPIR